MTRSAGINTTSHSRSLAPAQAVQSPLDFQTMRQNVNESQRQGMISP